jgi:hypothetical protein
MLYFLIFILIAIISVYIYALTRPDDIHYEKFKDDEGQQDKLPFIYY